MKGKKVVLVSTNFWHSPMWTRKQRFAQFFSEKGLDVLYVDPPAFISRTRRLSKGVKEEKIADNLYRVGSSLYVYTSAAPGVGKVLDKNPKIDKMRFFLRKVLKALPQINLIRYYLHYKNIKRVLKILGWNKIDLHWAYFPHSIFFKGIFNEKLFLFDWVDRFDSYPNTHKAYMKSLEERAVRKADLVFTTAKGLFEDAKEMNKNTHFLSNGVDFSLFFKGDKRIKGFLKKRGIHKENWDGVVAFVGAIREWIDVSLIGEVAKSLPKFVFVMAGPVERDVSCIENLENVKFLGMVPKEEVPHLLWEADVAINPFEINRLSRYVNPLKVYEYLAAGVPVVSVDMPEISHLRGIVSFANDPISFKDAILKEIKEDSPSKAKKRCEEARKYDWKTLQEKAYEIIMPFLAD